MTKKFLISASALVMGVAMSSAAFAADTDTGAGVLNVAGTDAGDALALTANSQSVDVDDNDETTINADNGNTVGSGNTLFSGNSYTKTVDVSKDYDTTINKEYKYSEDTTITAALTIQALDAAVVGNDIKFKASSEDDANNDVATGDILGGTSTSVAGVFTSAYNTGFSSVNQASTSLAANADISFGD